MGNRRLYNKSKSEYRRYKQRELKRLLNKRDKQHLVGRRMSRLIPNGYFEIDKVIVNFMRDYIKSLNKNQIFSSHSTNKGQVICVAPLTREMALCMHKVDSDKIFKVLNVQYITYEKDIISIEVEVLNGVTSINPIFQCQFSHPLFFQKFLLFLDRINLYYWCSHTTRWHIDKLEVPILQKLTNMLNIQYDLASVETGKIMIGSDYITILDGYVLTNTQSIATLEKAITEPHIVIRKIQEVLQNELCGQQAS